MANAGNFVDRSPYIKPAGQVKFRKDNNVGSCLFHEVTPDEVRPFVCKPELVECKLPPKSINVYKGYFTDVRECLQPESGLGHFDILRNEFKETVYDSYWKKEVGRVPDPTPMLPAGMDAAKECFGKAPPAPSTAGEIINSTSPFGVVSDSMEFHDMYKRTHHNYNPGEQINRNYLEPFNIEHVYGKRTFFDPSGGCMKKIMNTEMNGVTIVSKILSDYKKRNTCVVGKVHSPNNNIDCVPRGHVFGRSSKRVCYGTGELLKDSDPNLERYYLHNEISHINFLRKRITKKQPPFPHRDFLRQLHKYDFKNDGLICLQEAYKVLQEFEIFPDRSIFEALLSRLGILVSGKMIMYEKMADLFNVNVVFPEIKKLHDVPSEFLCFETTSQAAQRYQNNCEAVKQTRCIPKAGIYPLPHVSMDSVIRPANYSHYFLEAKDFFVSRTPEYFEKLLNRLGCEISKSKFNATWENAKDKNGCVSVNSFFTSLKNS